MRVWIKKADRVKRRIKQMVEENKLFIMQKTIEKARGGNVSAIREFWKVVRELDPETNKKQIPKTSDSFANLDIAMLTDAASKIPHPQIITQKKDEDGEEN